MLSRMHRLLVPLAVAAAVLLVATCSMGGAPKPPPMESPETESPETESPETESPETEPPMPAESEARYRVTFAATWSAATHPTNFPSGPHFSGLIGATHDADTRIWQLGELASDGIEQMAETGGKSKLRAEITALIAAGSAHGELSGGGLSTSPSRVILEFDVVATHAYVTLVSMLAPSPDWFVGVPALSLLESGTWKDREEVMLLLYDAGTDDGARFMSGDADSVPAQPISRLTSDTGDTDFTDGAPAVGTFLFEKLP